MMSMALIVVLLSLVVRAAGFGSPGSIAAAFGDEAFFCATDASGKQAVICWGLGGKNPSAKFSNVPPMAVLSGGDGFMCGILADSSSRAYCWDSNGVATDLVPSVYRYTSYARIAAGKSHVCAIRGYYYEGNHTGSVECWDVVKKSGSSSLMSRQSALFYDPYVSGLGLEMIVSGDGFSCGVVKDGGGVVCWGPNLASILGSSKVEDSFAALTAGRSVVCGVVEVSGKVKCWGDKKNQSNWFQDPPSGVQFISMTAGERHFCGIREDTHGVECWGDFNASAVPKGAGFFAISASNVITCGIREVDLVLDCWFVNESVTKSEDFDPPLQLSSPGLCTPRSCRIGEFAYNASTLDEAGLTSLCVRKDLHLCLPCALDCSEGYYVSSPCNDNSNRICTQCSFCQNSSCWAACGLQQVEMHQRRQRLIHKIELIVGPSIAGLLLILIGWCLFPYLFFFRGKDGPKKQFRSCLGKKDMEADGVAADFPNPMMSGAQCPGEAQIFRLSELKDATNGFKEFNELGRGSYGFVYKAVLTDGRQVAVKRANAATIIHTNIREFELELEILCKMRHCNIVNLLGYCTEMGERILVYEYMSHGTLHDHLHGGLSPLNWTQRLRIAMQAAKGLEYLHMEADPPVVHRDLKTSNILLDSDWGARISDFGLSNLTDKDLTEDMKDDVYNFGIVLLEILSGRKAYDVDYSPPNIVEWALPLIRKGKAAAIIDRYVALPRNVEPLLKLADIAEGALGENSIDRPSMEQLAHSLEQIVKEGLLL